MPSRMMDKLSLLLVQESHPPQVTYIYMTWIDEQGDRNVFPG